MEFHEVAGIFPLMDGAEYEALKADIAENGLREPVWSFQGKLIDGRNRWLACQELGVQPEVREWGGEGSLVAFVVSLNLHRRHLTSSQKATVAVEIEPLLAKEAKERMRQGGGDKKSGKQKVADPIPNQGQARDDAARITGTNRQYVSDAKTVKEKAPQLFEEVKAGKITLPQAKQEVRRKEKRQYLQEKAKTLPPTGNACRIIHGDCLANLDRKLVGTPRLIFADPPYNIGVDYGEGVNADKLPTEEYLAWCSQWMQAGADLLAPDGSFWVLIGDEYADHFGVLLRKTGLHRRAWVKWYETFGVNQTNNFNRCSRHLFYCVKDLRRFVFNADAVNRPSDRQTKYDDKRADPGGKIWDDVWQIPRLVGTAEERIPDFPTQLPVALLTPIILCASDPGDLVLDPFCGSATTGFVAAENGRRFIGIEKQEQFVTLGRQRLATVSHKGD